MKLLLVGNHTCGNRGDGAILRGLLTCIRKIEPNAKIDTITRYPVSSSFLLNETLHLDSLHHYHQQRLGKLDRLWKLFSAKLVPHILHNAVNGKWRIFGIPKHARLHIDTLKKYDGVIQVGGSFFVDLYREAQFEHSLCALLAQKPVYFLGHSVGPFRHSGFNRIAKTVFQQASLVSLREPVSLNLMDEADISKQKVHQGADTAWAVNNAEVEVPHYLVKKINQKPTIAITFRELAPFDKRLGVSQQQYENAFASLIDYLIEQGYQVMAFSTCTGIDSYHRDDRMIGLKVGKQLKNQAEYSVVMDELNDVQLGTLLSKCMLTIGTRLHSAIISMNFGTLAIALNYEHKSEGIMNQLELEHLSKPVESLFDGSLKQCVLNVLESIDEQQDLMNQRVEIERKRVYEMVRLAITEIRETDK